MVTEDSILQRDGAIGFAKVGDRWVALHPRTGQLLTLDAVGHDVWDCLEQRRSVAGVIERIAQRYQRCDAMPADIIRFIEQLLASRAVALIAPERAP